MTMPHMSSGGSEDFYSTDEVKVYKDEGNKDEEKRSSENLTEEKLGLVTESEEGKNSSIQGNFAGSEKSSNAVSDDDKSSAGPAAPGHGPPGSIGFFLPPYASAYPNGSAVAGKFGMVQPPYHGLVMYNDFTQPPPAHKGYPPVYTDPKTGLPRPPMYAAYPAPPGQFPHPLYSPEFTSASWHRPGYPLTSGAFAGSFPPSLSSLSRYGPPGLLSHPGLGHPGIPHHASLGAGPKSELMSPQLLSDSHSNTSGHSAEPPQKKKNHIKKPLNAFMLFMKEQRPKVIAECTLRESSAINQILGRRWHALDRSEQAKYYEMARKEKELHLQLYPGWSARDNYAAHQKKKKRKKDGSGGGGGSSMSGAGVVGHGGLSPMGGVSGMSGGGSLGCLSLELENKSGECPNEKKCRARYGIEQQSRWCKPCRRKKKCTRYKVGDEEGGIEDNEDCLLRELDSPTASACESDSSNRAASAGLQSEGRHLRPGSSSHMSDSTTQDSPLVSPGVPDTADSAEVQQPNISHVQPRLLSHQLVSRTSSPLSLTPWMPQPTHTPSPIMDSWILTPPRLHIPFHLASSPLVSPLSYIGFPPFHHHFPHTHKMSNG
ncbi:hypothetical protein BsWGS_06792 [Bradybaena similaris]